MDEYTSLLQILAITAAVHPNFAEDLAKFVWEISNKHHDKLCPKGKTCTAHATLEEHMTEFHMATLIGLSKRGNG